MRCYSNVGQHPTILGLLLYLISEVETPTMRALAVIALLAVTITTTAALECYECLSISASSSCSDPFYSTGLKKCTAQKNCYKTRISPKGRLIDGVLYSAAHLSQMLNFVLLYVIKGSRLCKYQFIMWC